MEVESQIDEVLQCIRSLFVTELDTSQETSCLLLDGSFIPMPSLRSLAFQSLVLQCFPVDKFNEFLPGFEEDARNLRRLTKDCEGKYKLVSFEDSLVYANGGGEGTEDDKETMRGEVNSPGIVNVVKNNLNNWEIGEIVEFSPAGCLKHVFRCGGDGIAEITDQDWIEGSKLVSHQFHQEEYSDDEADGEDDEDKKMNRDDSEEEGLDKVKFGIESRFVVTFYQDKFLYKERVVNTRKCTRCEECSYEYKIKAIFAKI